MSEPTQTYTYWAWVDADDLIRESGFCPTDSLADYPTWDRGEWRYVEHDQTGLVSETTHYYDAADGTIKPREEARVGAVARNFPPHHRTQRTH